MTHKDAFGLTDKRILITGASSGIGRQCAISCSRKGAKLVLLGRDQSRLNETLALLSRRTQHLIYSVDLLEYDRVSVFIDEIVSKIGRFDGVINCAGISTTLPLNSLSSDKMEYFLRTNVIGPINLTRQLVKSDHFSESGGSVIFISSVMSVVGDKGKALYSSTKGALVSTVRSLAVELATRQIRVNAVSPGVVESPMSKNAVYSNNVESLNRIRSLHPLGLGLPEDVANACIFLLSDAGRWVTGINLIIDGGYTAH
jgi:NAD(P)-dependent dehydrogenase (short-subunit alcohol dehydrogenase family)